MSKDTTSSGKVNPWESEGSWPKFSASIHPSCTFPSWVIEFYSLPINAFTLTADILLCCDLKFHSNSVNLIIRASNWLLELELYGCWRFSSWAHLENFRGLPVCDESERILGFISAPSLPQNPEDARLQGALTPCSNTYPKKFWHNQENKKEMPQSETVSTIGLKITTWWQASTRTLASATQST